MPTWFDLTWRLDTAPELDVNEVDGNIEITFSMPEVPDAKLTIQLPRNRFEALMEQGQQLLITGTVSSGDRG